METDQAVDRSFAWSGPDRNYQVPPSNKPGGYPGEAPQAPPPGQAGRGGWPGSSEGHPHPGKLGLKLWFKDLNQQEVANICQFT